VWKYVVESSRARNGKVDGHCVYGDSALVAEAKVRCGHVYSNAQAPDVKKHLTEQCKGVPDDVREEYARERTAPSRAAAARPVGVSGRQGAKQQSLITSLGDRKLTDEENAELQVLQLKAHLACGIPFRAADRYEYVNLFRQLPPVCGAYGLHFRAGSFKLRTSLLDDEGLHARSRRTCPAGSDL
jgi:hypothetical protein